jgi:hypothetical protein
LAGAPLFAALLGQFFNAPIEPIYDKGGHVGGSMDYLTEAKKFIQRAREGFNPEVVKADLEMADWCLSQAIKERDDSTRREPKSLN